MNRNSQLMWFGAILISLTLISCDDDFLTEKPLSSVSPEVIFNSKSGFEGYIVSLHEAARQEHTRSAFIHWQFNFWSGTDIAITGTQIDDNFVNYQTYLTPTRNVVEGYWEWAYRIMLVRANTVIHYAEHPDYEHVWENENEKNRIIAEARFFRAYTHNLLANLYGGVPVVEEYYTKPKTDFVRNTREKVYQSAKQDLEFASEWLPETVTSSQEGRIVKAAADHLLSEVYISLGEYDNAVESASRVIDSGLYSLMTDRFGVEQNQPGDVFSDLFKEGNLNRSSGNMESIYVWQFEDNTQGGLGSSGNWMYQIWAPFLTQLNDPDGVAAVVLSDTLLRGVAWTRPTTYFLYELWDDENDMRNSKYNIKRDYYYSNPASKYFGQKIEKEFTYIDTLQRIYPRIRKIEGKPTFNVTSSRRGRTAKDIMVYRLAETYLLRAEAHMKNGNMAAAADDINTVRERANATLVDPADVDLDYILDERARELIAEEPRRRTLTRVGKLVERTRRYNDYETTKSTIQDYHEFWPIPQNEIDANFSAELTQNLGY